MKSFKIPNRKESGCDKVDHEPYYNRHFSASVSEDMLKDLKVGESFTVTVKGKIESIRQEDNDQSFSMELEEVIFPDAKEGKEFDELAEDD